MNDSDQSLKFPVPVGDDASHNSWAPREFIADEEYPTVDPDAGLTSLGFITGALKRRAWLWCTIAIAGLLIGAGLYVKFPPNYHTSVTVLVIDRPDIDPTVAIDTDLALAQSDTVATSVIRQLRLRQSVASFRASYSVTIVTDRVLHIDVNAHSPSDAMARASALAASFLQFHAQYTQLQQQQLKAELNQQVGQAQRRLDSISRQISQVSAQPSSSFQRAKLATLAKQREDANNALFTIQQYATGTLATTQTGANAAVQQSRLIDAPSPPPHSKKQAILYFVGGLIAGLVIGMVIVIVGALVSSRLRRRDDVSAVLGAPVKFSVGRVRERRGLPIPFGRASRRDLHMKRVVAYLRSAVPRSSRGPAGLAVVALDNAQVVARALATLAVSCASEGEQVVVADLSDKAWLARLMGVREPGVRTVSKNGVNVVIVVPEPDDVAPIGPFRHNAFMTMQAHASEAVVDGCASADILLTLTTLDPGSDASHLVTWATDLVAIVTAGRSSAERIRAVGEMVRVAGMRLDSAVLIGADKGDESLGMTRTLDEPAPIRSV